MSDSDSDHSESFELSAQNRDFLLSHLERDPARASRPATPASIESEGLRPWSLLTPRDSLSVRSAHRFIPEDGEVDEDYEPLRGVNTSAIFANLPDIEV